MHNHAMSEAPPAAGMQQASNGSSKVIEVELGNCSAGSDLRSFEQWLRRQPGVMAVHLDRTRCVALVNIDRRQTLPEDLQAALRDGGFACRWREHFAHAEDAQHGAIGAMGAMMVHDMLQKALVSVILTVPIVFLSPLAARLGFKATSVFGVSTSLIAFALATVVVFWAGRMFIIAAYRAARHGEANMMTLISLGILVSYGYSVGATFIFAGDAYYDAAAMLTTVNLFGHWLDMRSRYTAGRSVEALLKSLGSSPSLIRCVRTQSPP